MSPDEIQQKLTRLEELETNFSGALERAKLAAIYHLAYGLSHEFNNPLANISSRAQTLLIDEKDPERRRKLATINAQAFRAHEMIADLMLFAKPPRLEKREVDLPELLSGIVAEMLALASEQDSKLAYEATTAATHKISADPTHLTEAIKAVIKNGLEALGQGGSIAITLENLSPNDDNSVAIVIHDSGPGITDAARRHLFDPYFSGREAGRGLGLGLSKCWRIIDEHGGRIDVASDANAGATFRLILPIM